MQVAPLMFLLFNLLLTLLLALGVAVLAGQNLTSWTVQFLLWRSVELPLGLLIAAAIGLGLLSVGLKSLLWPERNFFLIARQLQERLQQLEGQELPPA
ncbi:LapA family protein [Synechococcus sp. H70.2]|uniref:LapA family protein n=1 Tax=unclassified Synechococcus TaxID=2626047 RepID=UPI0039C33F77